MAAARIVCSGPLDGVAVDILQQFGEIVIASSNTEEAMLPLLEGAVALVVRGDGKANARIIAAAKDLKVIGRTGAGYENVDIAAATARRIPVVYTPGANARAVAEGAMALMLALCKNIAGWDQALKRGDWKSRFRSNPRDLEGATLGIIGFGRIGQLLAELARPFGMTILACDPCASGESAQRLGVRLTDLDELMAESDFIAIHAAQTSESKGMIDRRRLALVKPGSFLVNLARGGIVESLDVLHEALVRGTLAGVGLDVFEPEPPDVSHPIFSLPNCITSPPHPWHDRGCHEADLHLHGPGHGRGAGGPPPPLGRQPRGARVNLCMVGYGAIAEKHLEALRRAGGVRPRVLVGRRREPAE